MHRILVWIRSCNGEHNLIRFFYQQYNMTCNIFLTLSDNVKMPALGYGTWQSNDDSLEKALDYALEVGYRHIDTAARYQNEEIIGRVLKKWFDSGKLKREDLFITTKLPPTDMDPDKVEAALKESLKKLQLDYVDLYLIHFPIPVDRDEKGELYGRSDITYVDTWKAMEQQHDAGRAKFIGISNFNVKKVDHLLKNCRIKPANNQVEMHVYMQQKELVDFCTKNGVTVVAYCPLGSGLSYNGFLARFGKAPKELRDLLNDQTVVSIAKKHSKTSAQVLLRYLLQLGVAAIPKSVTPARVKENFDVFDFTLNEEDMKSLRGLEIGQDGRVCGFEIFEKVREHPDFEL